MKLRDLIFALLCAPAFTTAQAATVSCPDLAAAAQLAACPSEEDLKFTFNGYCSADARPYSLDTEACTDYRKYRRLKNVALWEAPGGDFQGYVSCDLPLEKVKAAKVSGIAVARQGKITRLVCSYTDGISFTYRTREACLVEAGKNCAADPAACSATCN